MRDITPGAVTAFGPTGFDVRGEPVERITVKVFIPRRPGWDDRDL